MLTVNVNLASGASPHSNFRPSMYSTASISDFVHGEDEAPKIQHTLHRPKTGRKTWKSLKEKKEAVWPEYLEVALLEALERYRPTSSKDPSSLRRFPKRNAYISNYIKEKTGVSRTPKQVGSRLQQLRETCSEERVIRLIVSRDFDAPDRVAAARGTAAPNAASRTAPALHIKTCMLPEYSPTSSNTTSGPLTASLSVDSFKLDPYEYPVTPYSDEFDHQSIRSSPSTSGRWPHAYVHIDLASTSSRRSSLEELASFTLDLDESGLTNSPNLGGPESWKWQRRISVPTASPVCYHTPSVSISSSILSSHVRYESLFRVQKDNEVLFEESTQLELVSETPCRPSLFRSSVLPKYWGSVASKTSILHQYMIIQDIYESAASTNHRVVDPIYTIVYKFDCSGPFGEQPYSGTPGSATSPSSPVSYFSSPPPPYEALRLAEDSRIRIPLAPIMTNTAHVGPAGQAVVGELLDYGAVGEYGSLLPPINASSVLESGSTPETLGWYTSEGCLQPNATGEFYSSTGLFNPAVQGVFDSEGYGYPALYSF